MREANPKGIPFCDQRNWDSLNWKHPSQELNFRTANHPNGETIGRELIRQCNLRIWKKGQKQKNYIRKLKKKMKIVFNISLVLNFVENFNEASLFFLLLRMSITVELSSVGNFPSD